MSWLWGWTRDGGSYWDYLQYRLVVAMWALVFLAAFATVTGVSGRADRAPDKAKRLPRSEALDLTCRRLNDVPMSVRAETVRAAMPDGTRWDNRIGANATLSCLGEPLMVTAADGNETAVCPAGRPTDSIHRAIACARRAISAT